MAAGAKTAWKQGNIEGVTESFQGGWPERQRIVLREQNWALQSGRWEHVGFRIAGASGCSCLSFLHAVNDSAHCLELTSVASVYAECVCGGGGGGGGGGRGWRSTFHFSFHKSSCWEQPYQRTTSKEHHQHLTLIYLDLELELNALVRWHFWRALGVSIFCLTEEYKHFCVHIMKNGQNSEDWYFLKSALFNSAASPLQGCVSNCTQLCDV